MNFEGQWILVFTIILGAALRCLVQMNFWIRLIAAETQNSGLGSIVAVL